MTSLGWRGVFLGGRRFAPLLLIPLVALGRERNPRAVHIPLRPFIHVGHSPNWVSGGRAVDHVFYFCVKRVAHAADQLTSSSAGLPTVADLEWHVRRTRSDGRRLIINCGGIVGTLDPVVHPSATGVRWRPVAVCLCFGRHPDCAASATASSRPGTPKFLLVFWRWLGCHRRPRPASRRWGVHLYPPSVYCDGPAVLSVACGPIGVDQ